MASKYIVCARKTLTSRILRALNSSSNRSKLCQDVPSIARSNACHGPSGKVLISVSIQDCLREGSEEFLKQFVRVGNTCLDNVGECGFELRAKPTGYPSRGVFRLPLSKPKKAK